MNTIKISVPIESLAQAICSLNWSEQQKLREILDDQLFESEEEWEHSPEIKAEVAEAKKLINKENTKPYQNLLPKNLKINDEL
ncbi:hypothetical protein NON20_20680 [Synechocystis sp. B12]|nr:hypothetical protein NON20_20680 [Synechocystis sp. B12]